MQISFNTKDKEEILRIGEGGFSLPTLNKFLKNPKNFSGHARVSDNILKAIKEYNKCAWEIIINDL